MEFIFEVSLPDALAEELMDAARESRCSPTIFAAESLESALASRRLPRVPAAALGARIGAAVDEHAEPEGYPVRVEYGT